jgi:hypothetical protein
MACVLLQLSFCYHCNRGSNRQDAIHDGAGSEKAAGIGNSCEYGSPAVFPWIQTRGFASPPFDGFAFIYLHTIGRQDRKLEENNEIHFMREPLAVLFF